MAQPRGITVKRSLKMGQVLAFLAVILPTVLLPVAAYVVDAAVVASRSASLQAATAQAAEAAAQQLNVGMMRSGGVLALDASAVALVAAGTIGEEEPGAFVDSTAVDGIDVVVVTHEPVTLPFSVFIRTTTLHSRATARLAVGFESPSSQRIPEPSPGIVGRTMSGREAES